MGIRGAIIVGFFGTVFAAMTLAFPLHWSGPRVALPFLVFAVICALALWIRRQPGSGVAMSGKVRRTMIISTIGEVIGIIGAIAIATRLGHPEMILPAFALMVGLHLFPIAYVGRLAHLYILGVALLIAAACGFALGTPTGGEIAGFTAAGGLWLTASLALYRDVQAKRQTDGPLPG